MKASQRLPISKKDRRQIVCLFLFSSLCIVLLFLCAGKRSRFTPFSMPLADAVLTSGYGYRKSPFDQTREKHRGIDLDAYWKAPVMAAADGVVYRVCTSANSYGNYVVLAHQRQGKTLYTLYAHLHEVKVVLGEQVGRGAILGSQGGDPQKDSNAGASTGSHLHFEVRTEDGADVDPALYLPFQ